jgi:hypothetical protein
MVWLELSSQDLSIDTRCVENKALIYLRQSILFFLFFFSSWHINLSFILFLNIRIFIVFMLIYVDVN